MRIIRSGVGLGGACWPIVLLAWMLTGCSPAGSAPESEALLSSMQASAAGHRVELVLQLTNTTQRPLEANFSSGQEYDFVIEQGGVEVWRWSADQMFIQALTHRTIGAGETVRFEAEWDAPPSAHGNFVAIGFFTARDHPVVQRVEFTLP